MPQAKFTSAYTGEQVESAIKAHIGHTATTDGAVRVGKDAFGHVVLGTTLTTAQDGTHSHDVTASIPANNFLISATPSSTKISLNKQSDTFVKSYPGVISKMVTTSITGVSGSTTASKATAGTAVNVATVDTAVAVATRSEATTKVGNANVGASYTIAGVSGSTTASKATAGDAVSIAKVGTAVTYGTADCDAAITGVAKVKAEAITYGGANVGTAESVAYGVQSATASVTQDAYTAAYNEAEECLTLTPATISVTPTVTLNTKEITPAVPSSSTAYVCADGTGVSITPAKASSKTLTPAASNGTITPWTFTDVTVPMAATAVTFNGAVLSSTEVYTVGDVVDIVPAKANGTITPWTFSDVTVPTAASATTVATGSLALDATGDFVLIGLGTATTASALTSASVQSDESTGDVTVVTSVSTSQNSEVSISGTAAENGQHNHAIQ